MKKLICLLVLITIVPGKSFAAFKSQEHLLETLAQAGYNEVIEFPGGNGAPKIKVHNYNGRKIHIENIDSYSVGREERVSALDYIENPTALLAPDVMAQAYQIDNLFICYRFVGQVFKTPSSIRTCFIFPVDVNEVIDALKTAKKI